MLDHLITCPPGANTIGGNREAVMSATRTFAGITFKDNNTRLECLRFSNSIEANIHEWLMKNFMKHVNIPRKMTLNGKVSRAVGNLRAILSFV